MPTFAPLLAIARRALASLAPEWAVRPATWRFILLALVATNMTSAARPETTEALSRAGRALLDAASMEPVDLGMEAGFTLQIPGSLPTYLPGDHRIIFRVPAATVSMIDVKDGRMQGQRLGFELWSGTLDPVRADLAPDRAGCRPGELSPCASAGPDGGRVGARYRAGEYVLKVTVTNHVGVLGRSERVLRAQSGIHPVPRPDVRIEPCDVREDPELEMLVGRAPEGVEHFSACGFGTNGAVLKGRPYPPAHFMRLAPDGSPKFVVKCSTYVAAGEDTPPRPCEMLGYYGAWPLFLWVMSDRAPEWDATFERVRDYLARHTTFRTDAPADGNRAP